MASVMAGRWVCHAREATLLHQVFVCLRPNWDGVAVWGPVGVCGLVTPFRKMRHSFRVRRRTAKLLHSPLTSPHSQGPERAPGVDEESSTREPGRAHDLALRKKGLPQERWEIFHGANAKTRDGCKHGSSICLYGCKKNPNSCGWVRVLVASYCRRAWRTATIFF